MRMNLKCLLKKSDRIAHIYPIVDQQILFDFSMNKFNIDKQ